MILSFSFLSWTSGCFKYLILIYTCIPIMHYCDGSATEWAECPYFFQQGNSFTLMTFLYNWGKCSQRLCSALRNMEWLHAEEVFFSYLKHWFTFLSLPLFFRYQASILGLGSHIFHIFGITHGKVKFAFSCFFILKLWGALPPQMFIQVTEL